MAEPWVEEVKEIFDRYDLKVTRKGNDFFIIKKSSIDKVRLQLDLKEQEDDRNDQD